MRCTARRKNKCKNAGRFSGPRFLCKHGLPERHVKDHHRQKTGHDAERANMRMLAKLRFRDQLLDDDVQHRARRKGQKPRHERRDLPGDQYDQNAEHRLDDAGQAAVSKSPPAAQPLLPERERYGGALGKVLDADAELDQCYKLETKILYLQRLIH